MKEYELWKSPSPKTNSVFCAVPSGLLLFQAFTWASARKVAPAQAIECRACSPPDNVVVTMA